MFSVVHLNGNFAQTVIVRPNVVRSVEMAVEQAEFQEIVTRRTGNSNQLGILLDSDKTECQNVALWIGSSILRVRVD